MADSRDVAVALKASVFPALRGVGLARFRSRAAWRDSWNTAEVIDFHSLGSYFGSAVGATSHSFGGNVGLYYKALHTAPWATDLAPEWPDESACHARRFLRKSLFQLWHRRPDVWYVNPEGSNLDPVIVAFESREDPERRSGIGLETYGGGLNSFARAEAASALALACGQPKGARDAWQRMLANPYYRRIPELQREAERRLALI